MHDKINYYIDWILSLGNKDGLLLIETIKFLTSQKKQITKSLDQEKATQYLNNGKAYFKHFDRVTLEWIKTQPYFTKCQYQKKNLQQEDILSLTDESYSIKYLELIGMNIANTDEIHSLLKKFKHMNCLLTNDILGSSYHGSKQGDEQFYEEYTKAGLQRPNKITEKRSLLIRDVNTDEELYLGHFVLWLKIKVEYVKSYCVVVIDEKLKCGQTETTKRIFGRSNFPSKKR